MNHIFTTTVIPSLLVAMLTAFLIWLARKKDIAALREQADQLKVFFSIIEQVRSTIELTDLDGNIQYVNPRFTETTGYTFEEVKGKKPSVLKSGDTSSEEYRVLWETISLGGVWRGRFHNRKKNGDLYWEQAQIFPLTDTNGKTIFYAALKEDITQQVLAEEKLDESEEHYRLLFENSMDAILLTAPDGSILSVNPAACKMFQNTEAEIRNLGRNGLVDMTDPRLPVLLEERARVGKATGELTMLRSDGSKFPVELSSSIFVNRDGSIHTSMIIRDITERKHAEAALYESEEKYRALFNHLPIPAFTKDLGGVYTSCNEEELKYWETSPIGRTDRRCFQVKLP